MESVPSTILQAVSSFPVLLLTLILLLAFFFYLLSEVCEEALTPALEGAAEDLNISHDVACATFVAFGASASEIAVNSAGAFQGSPEALNVSSGALLGSALLSFSLIPAACIVVSPGRELVLEWIPLIRDLFFFSVSLLIVVVACKDGEFDSRESVCLIGVFFLYVFALLLLNYLFYNNGYKAKQPPRSSGEYGTIMSSSSHVEEGESSEMRRRSVSSDSSISATGSADGLSVVMRFIRFIKKFIPPFGVKEKQVEQYYGRYLIVSIVYIAGLSNVCLLLAVELANLLNISHHFTGLVLVAFAAQVEDFTACMAIARKGQGPGSISSAISSQIMNLTLGFGLPFLISNILRKHPVPVTKENDTAQLVLLSAMTLLCCNIIGGLRLKVRDALVFIAIYGFVIWNYWKISVKEADD